MRKSFHKTLIVSCISFFWLLFIIFSLYANNPSTTNVGFKFKKNLIHLMPQGWGFFTKDPRGPIVDAYIIEGENLKLLTYNNLSRSNWFGLSRNSRRIGFELSELFGKIPKEKWIEKTGVFDGAIPTEIYEIKIEQSLYKFNPGEYLLHQYKTIPFAWADKGQEKYQPYNIIRIQLIKD